MPPADSSGGTTKEGTKVKVDFETDVGAGALLQPRRLRRRGVFPAKRLGCGLRRMGGARGGNVASAVAVEHIKEKLLGGFREDLPQEGLRDLLVQAVTGANGRRVPAGPGAGRAAGHGHHRRGAGGHPGRAPRGPRGRQPGLPEKRGGLPADHHGPLLRPGPGELRPDHQRGGPGPPPAEHHHPGAGGPPHGGVRLRPL